ncbi:MAG: hypothetical protein ACKO2P_05180 [Planctomycetota bacterium]
MRTIRQMATSFIRNEHGYILSSEFLLLATVTVLGLLVGIVSVRDSLLLELQEIADVIGKLNQSYSYTGVSNGDILNGGPSTEGGVFEDTVDESEAAFSTTTLVFYDPFFVSTAGSEE